MTAAKKKQTTEEALEVLMRMSIIEQHAFVALFARTCQNEWLLVNDRLITGKCECELVDDWREFYAERLPKAGLVEFSEKKARGIHYVYVRPTALGAAVRDAWWTTCR